MHSQGLHKHTVVWDATESKLLFITDGSNLEADLKKIQVIIRKKSKSDFCDSL